MQPATNAGSGSAIMSCSSLRQQRGLQVISSRLPSGRAPSIDRLQALLWVADSQSNVKISAATFGTR